MTIRNTAKTGGGLDVLLAAIDGEHPGKTVQHQEARGQAELCQVTDRRAQLPAKGMVDFPKEWAALGVEIVAPSQGDPLFVDVVLPEGWAIVASAEHSMWSDLLDERGRKRAEIFYKAAFYDRKAHVRICPRFHVGTRREDGECVAFTVEDHSEAPPRVVHEVAVPDVPGTKYHRMDLADTACQDALGKAYPFWRDPTAYWDAGPVLDLEGP